MKTKNLKKDIERMRAELNIDEEEFRLACKRDFARWFFHVYSENVLTNKRRRRLNKQVQLHSIESGAKLKKLDWSDHERTKRLACRLLTSDNADLWLHDERLIKDYCSKHFSQVDKLLSDYAEPGENVSYRLYALFRGYSAIVNSEPILIETTRKFLKNSKLIEKRRLFERVLGKPVKFAVKRYAAEPPLIVLIPFYTDGIIGDSRLYPGPPTHGL